MKWKKTVQFTNHNALFTTGIRTFPGPHDAEITLISVFLGNKKKDASDQGSILLVKQL